MSNKMLVDAIHPEETRVVVVRDKRVEDFDFEAASRKPLRGNIYLAKVTRVEPSLQAAFVDYGGNRHGFLAFSEIHPDYYQIPLADRAALLEAEREDAEEEEEEQKPRRSRSRRGSRGRAKETSADDAPTATADAGEDAPAVDVAEAGAEAEDISHDVDEVERGEPGPEGVDAEAIDATAADEPTPADDASAEPAQETATVPPAEPGEDEGDAASTTSAPKTAKASTGARAKAKQAPAPEAEPKEAEAAEEPTAETADAAVAAPEDAEEKPKPKRRRRTTTTKKATTKKSDDGLDQPVVAEREPDDTGDEPGDDTREDDAGDTADAAGDGDGEVDAPTVAAQGNSDALEEIPERRRRPQKRHYKIQDVIKRKQILLVQVVKEERGTKGAALTTYLSLAGRYSVLMPNTDRGGGVSRKITDNADRKRLKSLVSELEVPEGMGIILRTAGASRTKTEIKRDFEYLLRLWESVRELTLKSIAPNLVYEEGNLTKRAIRDLYSKEIDEVLVSGDGAYREAKDFMKMLMPSHAKNVKPYREATPIFTAYQVEQQLDAMFSPQVTLPSKGYIVINPTEALVAIDVNSGRSTKESNIEDTALKTNLEAADEVARQLRLRDLAGLIVIDFIDMDEKRHNRQVEKRLKDALKLDRSRIQVGRISSFGLLEMSRQRIRQGMVETSQVPCPMCAGTGLVRSTPSVALFCLRSLEEHLLKQSNNHITLKTSAGVALYILNQKRSHLHELEERFQLEIAVDADETLSGSHMEIVTGAVVERAPGDDVPTTQLSPDAVDLEEAERDQQSSSANSEAGDGEGGGRSGKRRRRRRRRGGDGDNRAVEATDETVSASEYANGEDGADRSSEAVSDDDSDGDGDGDNKRRRRGRRGGRRHRRDGETADAEISAEAAADESASEPASTVQEIEISDGPPAEEPQPEAAAAPDPETSEETVTDAGADADGAVDDEQPQSAELSPNTDEQPEEVTAAPQPEETVEAEAAPEQKSAPRPRRVGWWQRRSFF